MKDYAMLIKLKELVNCGATIIDKTAMVFQAMKTFEITFYYGPAN